MMPTSPKRTSPASTARNATNGAATKSGRSGSPGVTSETDPPSRGCAGSSLRGKNVIGDVPRAATTTSSNAATASPARHHFMRARVAR